MDLAIALDSRLPQPLHQQIYEELRRAILTGRLLPRQKIPST
ncbi:GntR family transcriptional regulator, partial [Trichormus variabilis]